MADPDESASAMASPNNNIESKSEHIALDVKEVDEGNLVSHSLERVKEFVSGSRKTNKANNKATNNPLDIDFDSSLLHRAVADGGRWAYGVILVEVWVLNREKTQLFRPEYGWWIDPVYHSRCGKDCKICRLTNPTRKSYIPPAPLCPGEGLPGVLWADSGRANTTTDDKSRSDPGNMRSSFSRSFDPRRRQSFASRNQQNTSGFGLFNENALPDNAVSWREIKSIASDPDQPFNPRLQLLADIGLGWAAAVPFNVHGQKGIVVYMARENVDMKRLRSLDNEHYLLSSSALIGAAYAMRGPRQKMQHQRRAELDSVIRRVRAKIISVQRAGRTLEDVAKSFDIKKQSLRHKFSSFTETDAPKKCKQGVQLVQRKVKATAVKCKGAGSHPPPPFDWVQTAWTFSGSFLTLLMVTRFNEYLVKESDSDFMIVLGPFGALVTLLYGLTAAPASQPRNAILGQTLSLTISLGISYADGMSSWMKQSLATALAVAAMAKLGLTHPPAGAAALLFSTGKYGWSDMLFMIIGTAMAVGASTIINNSSDYRQYPTFWGLRFVADIMERCRKVKNDSKAE